MPSLPGSILFRYHRDTFLCTALVLFLLVFLLHGQVPTLHPLQWLASLTLCKRRIPYDTYDTFRAAGIKSRVFFLFRKFNSEPFYLCGTISKFYLYNRLLRDSQAMASPSASPDRSLNHKHCHLEKTKDGSFYGIVLCNSLRLARHQDTI